MKRLLEGRCLLKVQCVRTGQRCLRKFWANCWRQLFSSHSNPLTSTKTLKLINFKTPEERQEVFRPLELDIAYQLQQQEGDLTVEGLYAPQGKIQTLLVLQNMKNISWSHFPIKLLFLKSLNPSILPNLTLTLTGPGQATGAHSQPRPKLVATPVLLSEFSFLLDFILSSCLLWLR